MMFINASVAFLFRIINALALAGLVYYLFKKYALGTIKSGIVQKQEELKNLQAQAHSLSKQYEKIADHIEEQEKEGSILLEKVKKWRAAIQDLEYIQDKEYQDLQEQAYVRAQQQAVFTAQQQLQALVIPEALMQARSRLTDEFADKTRGKIFLKELVAQLQKEQ